MSETSRSGVQAVAESILKTSQEKFSDKIIDAQLALIRQQRQSCQSHLTYDPSHTLLLSFKIDRVKAAIALSIQYLYDDAGSFHQILSMLNPASLSPQAIKLMNQIQELFLRSIDYRFPVSIDTLQPQAEICIRNMLVAHEQQTINKIADQLQPPKDTQEEAVLTHLHNGQASAGRISDILSISDETLAAIRWAEAPEHLPPPGYIERLEATIEQTAKAALLQSIQDIMEQNLPKAIAPAPALVTTGPVRYCGRSS